MRLRSPIAPLFLLALLPTASAQELFGTEAALAQDAARAAQQSARAELLAAQAEILSYRFTSEAPQRFSARNNAQRLRGRVDASGLSVDPRGEDEGLWSFSLGTAALGRAGALKSAGAAQVSLKEERVELRRVDHIEWFENGPRGFEQGWTILTPPPGPAYARLEIELALDGLEPELGADGRSLRLLDGDGELRLRYSGLRAWDATGRELDARLALEAGAARVEVELEGAVYPVEVDPTISGPAWLGTGDQANASFGFGVTGVGDVNGDGYDDVLIGAPDYDGIVPDEGAVFLFYGSADGLAQQPAWSYESDQPGALLGSAVAGAGDVNGDGYADFVVGAMRWDGGQQDEGRALLFLGSATGPAAQPDWTAEVDQLGALFGCAVDGAGDVNGDGYADFVVGARQYSNGLIAEGAAFLYLGSPSGPAAGWSWRATGGQTMARFGWSVAGAGDVNGDGYDDVLVGAPDYDAPQLSEGRVFLFDGGPAGLSNTASWTAEGDQTAALFGMAVSGAGDVDADGYDDLLVGARWYDFTLVNEGGAFLYRGSPAGPSATADWSAGGGQANASFGESVTGVGDIDGDGFGDIAVGAVFYDAGQNDEGLVSVFRGSPIGPDPAADWTAQGQQPLANYGRSVSGAGDVDGNGLADLLAGGDRLDFSQPNEGGAVLYQGRTTRVEIVCVCDGVDRRPPCGNVGGPFRGCANSAGPGALLWGTGLSSVTRDRLVLSVSGATSNQLGAFFQGTQLMDIQGGTLTDGLRCAGGSVVRIQLLTTAHDGSAVTTVPIAELGGVQPGDTRIYQYWFKDPSSICGTGVNSTNALRVRWTM